MDKKKDGGPAFPSEFETEYGVRIKSQGMSLRVYAAIKLKVPDSDIDWLDEMIIKSRRNDIAVKAMQSLMTGTSYSHLKSKEEISEGSYRIADVIIKNT
jgi:hypothetical protein